VDHRAAGITLAFVGLGLCLLAGLLAGWSWWRIPGTDAGAALSSGCTVLSAAGAVLAVCGAVVAHAA
jgi:uncharacterized membrane protein